MHSSLCLLACLTSLTLVRASETTPEPAGFNNGTRFKAFSASGGSPDVPGAQVCHSAKQGSDRHKGFPYNDTSLGTFEHSSNENGGCQDKLQSYKNDTVDFQQNNYIGIDGTEIKVAPECFSECPADEDAPCGKDVWEVAEDHLISRFGEFYDAYQQFESMHANSTSTNTTYDTYVVQKSTWKEHLQNATEELMRSAFTDADLYDEHSSDGLNATNEKVANFAEAEEQFRNYTQLTKTEGDKRQQHNRDLRNRIFELEMALLRYHDAAYQEVWSRDYACAVYLNHHEWKNLFEDARQNYTEKSATWQSREDHRKQTNQGEIDVRAAAHKTQMAEDEQRQRNDRQKWLTDFQKQLRDEDQARLDDLNARDTEVKRFVIMAKLRLRLLNLFAEQSQGMHSMSDSADVRRRTMSGSVSQGLSDVEFKRLLSASKEDETKLMELKSRIASSLEKTLQLDPATSAVQVTKITRVTGGSGSEPEYDVEYEIRMKSEQDAKRIAPAIGGSGKGIFQRVMKGNLEMEIAKADKKGETVLSGLAVGDVKSDSTSLRVSQQSNANKAAGYASLGASSSGSSSGIDTSDARAKHAPFAMAGVAIVILVEAVHLFA